MAETEIIQHAAGAILPPDLAILKLENDSIQALATARPRDMEKIKGELESQMRAFPILAEKAIYRKPVGREGRDGPMKFAEGLSIKAAEALAEVYGYCRVRVDVTPVDDNAVKVEATFTDYQKGRIWQDAGLVSKFYRDKYGKNCRHGEDRFYNVVVKAEASRRVREVITRSVSPGLKAWFEDACRKIAATKLDDETVKRIVEKFARLGVTAEEIEKFLGKPISVGLTQQDRLDLLATWNAIESGETTVTEAFERNAGSNGQNGGDQNGAGGGGQNGHTGASGPVNADSLTGALTGGNGQKPPAGNGEQTPPAPETQAAQTQQQTPPQPPAQSAEVLPGLSAALNACQSEEEVAQVKLQFELFAQTEDQKSVLDFGCTARAAALKAGPAKTAKKNRGALVE